MKAIRLRTEYLNNPIGVHFSRPRLTWNCEGGEKQTAYRIVTENWDSGKVESASMQAEYPLELSDRERDIIKKWNGRDVKSVAELSALYDKAMSALDKTTQVGVDVMRKGRMVHLVLNYRTDPDKEDET